MLYLTQKSMMFSFFIYHCELANVFSFLALLLTRYMITHGVLMFSEPQPAHLQYGDNYFPILCLTRNTHMYTGLHKGCQRPGRICGLVLKSWT